MEKLANYLCIRTSILTKKLGAFVVAEKSQEFLFQWDPTSYRLVDFREIATVEHKQINERHRRQSHYKLESERGNTNYNVTSAVKIS